MRLFAHLTPDGPALGVSPGEGLYAPLPGLDLPTLAQSGLEPARRALEGPLRPMEGLQMLAPVPRPVRNVFALGWNYADHSRETAALRGKEAKLPARPVFFTKATTAVTGPFAPIPYDPELCGKLDWEVELGVVIGKGGKDIPKEEALAHVLGYTVINDVSARDLQMGHGGQFFKGKSLDGTCPMGPWIVTTDELPDPHHLGLRCWVNGVLKQEGNTADLLFDVTSIISWLSRGLTLLPGDVIATGTPSGVGFARNPPEFLRPGDVVECEVDGIGRIRNAVVPIP